MRFPEPDALLSAIVAEILVARSVTCAMRQEEGVQAHINKKGQTCSPAQVAARAPLPEERTPPSLSANGGRRAAETARGGGAGCGSARRNGPHRFGVREELGGEVRGEDGVELGDELDGAERVQPVLEQALRRVHGGRGQLQADLHDCFEDELAAFNTQTHTHDQNKINNIGTETHGVSRGKISRWFARPPAPPPAPWGCACARRSAHAGMVVCSPTWLRCSSGICEKA